MCCPCDTHHCAERCTTRRTPLTVLCSSLQVGGGETVPTSLRAELESLWSSKYPLCAGILCMQNSLSPFALGTLPGQQDPAAALSPRKRSCSAMNSRVQPGLGNSSGAAIHHRGCSGVDSPAPASSYQTARREMLKRYAVYYYCVWSATCLV
jgi:hypothetical protein